MTQGCCAAAKEVGRAGIAGGACRPVRQVEVEGGQDDDSACWTPVGKGAGAPGTSGVKVRYITSMGGGDLFLLAKTRDGGVGGGSGCCRLL